MKHELNTECTPRARGPFPARDTSVQDRAPSWTGRKHWWTGRKHWWTGRSAHGWAPHLSALLGYFILACTAFWNVLKDPFTTVVGVPHLHVWEELWHFWWTRTALAAGESPFRSHLLGFPADMNVFYDMSSISLPLVAVPLQAWLGVVGAYNAIAFLAVLAAACGGYLLCRRVRGGPLAAFLGGIVYGFSPFLQTELSNGMLENLFAFAFLPWFVLCLLRLQAKGRWTDGLAAGLVAGVAALSSWYFLVMAGFLSVLFICAAYLANRMCPIHPGASPGGPGAPAFAELRRGKPRTDRRFPSASLRTRARLATAERSEDGRSRATLPSLSRSRSEFAVPRSPLLVPYAVLAAVVLLIISVPLTALTTGPTLERGVPWKDCVRGPLMQKSCIDVLRLFTHGGPAAPAEPQMPADAETMELLPFGVYLGKIVLFFILLALFMPVSIPQFRVPSSAPALSEAEGFRVPRSAFRVPPSAFWKLGFLLALLLMLGPYLNIGGRVDWGPIRIPLLSRLLLVLPGTGRVLALHNYRFAACVLLFGAVLFTFAADRVLVPCGARSRRALAALIAWLILADFGNSAARGHLLHLPVSNASLPTVYAAIAGDPAGALFNIPVSSGAHARPDIRGIQMYHQLAHRRPIPCDPIYVLDPPDNETALARAARQMATGMPWELDDQILAENLETLRTQGFRFVVIHRSLLAEQDYARIDTLVRRHLGDPVAEDAGIEIFRLSGVSPLP